MAWLEIWDTENHFVEEFHFNDSSMTSDAAGMIIVVQDLMNVGDHENPKIIYVNLNAWGFIKWVTDHAHDMENVPELEAIDGGKGDE